MKYLDLPISDAHIHIFWNVPLAEKEAQLEKLMKKFNYDTVTDLAIPFNGHRKVKRRDFTENLAAFYLKCKMPGRVYAYAGFSPSYDEQKNTPEFFLNQAKFYMEAGFDGIKMIEGRPNQKDVSGRYSDEKYQLFYEYAEREQIPIVMHSNAPELLWHEGKKLHGTKPDWLDYHNEIVDILKKYPKLRLTIAHFAFASERMECAMELLDNFPNVYLDLCPNQFMYLDFSKKQKEWKEFFIKYQDRLIYGTDIGSNTTDLDGSEAESLVYMVRGFFEETKPYSSLGYDFNPIPLDESILRKFYKENMMNFYKGLAPRKPKPDIMKKELDFVKSLNVFLELRDLENIKVIESVF